MNEVQEMFIKSVQDEDADRMLVSIISSKIYDSLAESRNDGRTSWFNTDVIEVEELVEYADDNMSKGSLLDAIIYLSMAYVREMLDE